MHQPVEGKKKLKAGVQEELFGQPVTMKEFREALRSHNAGMEVSMNDNYNKAKKLGRYAARSIAKAIANAKEGDGNAKISMADAKNWAESMLPVDSGYPSQDTKPYMETLITELLK